MQTRLVLRVLARMFIGLIAFVLFCMIAETMTGVALSKQSYFIFIATGTVYAAFFSKKSPIAGIALSALILGISSHAVFPGVLGLWILAPMVATGALCGFGQSHGSSEPIANK